MDMKFVKIVVLLATWYMASIASVAGPTPHSFSRIFKNISIHGLYKRSDRFNSSVPIEDVFFRQKWNVALNTSNYTYLAYREIIDVNSDGLKEILIVLGDGRIFVLDSSTGSIIRRIKLCENVSLPYKKSMYLVDNLLSDTTLELLVLCRDKIYISDLVYGWVLCIPVYMNPSIIRTVNIDSDNCKEILVANNTCYITIDLPSTDILRIRRYGFSASKILFYDINRDSIEDIIIAKQNPNLSCLVVLDIPSGSTLYNLSLRGEVKDLLVEDIDYNYYPDVIVFLENRIYIIEFQDAPSITYIIPPGTIDRFIVLADINNDKFLDIIIQSLVSFSEYSYYNLILGQCNMPFLYFVL